MECPSGSPNYSRSQECLHLYLKLETEQGVPTWSVPTFQDRKSSEVRATSGPRRTTGCTPTSRPSYPTGSRQRTPGAFEKRGAKTRFDWGRPQTLVFLVISSCLTYICMLQGCLYAVGRGRLRVAVLGLRHPKRPIERIVLGSSRSGQVARRLGSRRWRRSSRSLML